MIRVAVILRSDPVTNSRGAEAFRVALGLASGPLEVDLFLQGPGVLSLAANVHKLEAGDELGQHRGRLASAGVEIHAAGAALAQLDCAPEIAVQSCDGSQMAERIARADRVIVF